MAAYRVLKLEDFSGGLNLQDAPSQVGNTEATDCMNITLDEMGGVVKRLGISKYNTSALPASPKYLFFSEALGLMIAQVGATMYKSTGDGTWTSFGNWSTSARCQCVDYLSKVVAIHPVDGCASYDGGATKTNIPQSPKGNVITSWQNALWSAGDPAQTTRLTRSDPGAITWPGSPITVDVRDRDDYPITALHFSQGLDTQGRPGLLAFKNNSMHRVNDATTGKYTTMSTDAGCGGPMCVTSLYGVTAFINARGIYTTNGLDKVELVSEKIGPIFTPQQVKYATQGDWVAGSYRDRFVFALNRNAATANDLLLEFHPGDGWIVPHQIPVGAMTTWTKNDRKLYSASSNNGYVYETFRGGSDDGLDITSHWQSRWFEPLRGYEMRMRRLIVQGRGTYDLYVKGNYRASGILCPVSTYTPSALPYFIWNESNWNEAVWGPSTGYEDYARFHSLGHARSVSFSLTETSQASATGPNVLPDGSPMEVGAFAMYGLHLDLVSLSAA
jgi:hypothetical protein